MNLYCFLNTSPNQVLRLASCDTSRKIRHIRAEAGVGLLHHITEHKGLSLGAACDGATPKLQQLIREATVLDLLLRTENASDFLAGLDAVEEASSVCQYSSHALGWLA